MFFSLGRCSATVLIFLYRDTLHLSLDQIGKVLAWPTIAMFALLIPAGYISDRFHPLRVLLASYAGIVVTSLICFFFIRDRNTMLVCLLWAAIPETLHWVAFQPTYVALLPKDRYGQFLSANVLVSSVGVILGNVLTGLFMDWVGDYRYAFIWQAAFVTVSLSPRLPVYRGWKRFGGAVGYVPPAVLEWGSSLRGSAESPATGIKWVSESSEDG
jgi:predicted MFS family arabinose efflux permease